MKPSVAAAISLCAALLVLPTVSAVADPGIRDLKVALDGQRVLVSLELVDGFDDTLKERIESGLPSGVSYELELLKDRKRWFDQGLATAHFQVVAMYNAVTHEYLVNYKLEGRLIESRQLHDLTELEHALTRVDALPAFGLAGVPRGPRLLVRVRAELGSRTLLSFIPTHVTTDWAESRKFRVRAAE